VLMSFICMTNLLVLQSVLVYTVSKETT